MTLNGNLHNTAPMRATKVLNFGALLKKIGTAIFSYKMNFLINFLVVALNEVEVEILVL